MTIQKAMSKAQLLFKNEVFKVVRKELLLRRETQTLTAICKFLDVPPLIAGRICNTDPDKISIDRLLNFCEKLDISVELKFTNRDETSTVNLKGVK